MSKRILFVLQYPGYLRYYDSTVKLLADRGHDVTVIFEQPKKQAEGLKALEGALERVVIKSSFPERSPIWDAVPRGLRRITDWVRYLDPRLHEAHYLRSRSADLMPRPFRVLSAKVDSLGSRTSRLLLKGLLALERCVPPYASVRHLIAAEQPDVLVVSPLVTSSSREVDIVKAAQREGVPTVAAIASWDHLSSKGLLREKTDRVIVWNQVQRQEAIDFHDVSPERIVITGAQPWDRWFDRAPRTTADEFREKVGLPLGKPFVLFVGSTASISVPEAELEFVREWVSAVQDNGVAEVHDLAILVRPHPYNPGLWESADLSDLGHVAVWPRSGANPVDDDDRANYYDSMFHSVAVVGINTSAMMEAAIVGRPVFTIRAPQFVDSQSGTVHFTYLLPENGGFVHAAASLDEHIAQLERVLIDPGRSAAQIADFLSGFVRPHGLQRTATPFVCDVIEELAFAGRNARVRMSMRRMPGRAILWLVASTQFRADRRILGRTLVQWGNAMSRVGEGCGGRVETVMCRLAAVIRKLEFLLRVNHRDRRPLLRLALEIEITGVRVGNRVRSLTGSLQSRLKQRGKVVFAKGQEQSARRKEQMRKKRVSESDARRSKNADRQRTLTGTQR